VQPLVDTWKVPSAMSAYRLEGIVSAVVVNPGDWQRNDPGPPLSPPVIEPRLVLPETKLRGPLSASPISIESDALMIGAVIGV
jgi:hypothetical protein